MSKDPAPPSFIAHVDDVREIEDCYPPPFDGEKLSFLRDLGEATGSRSLGFVHERVPPGHRTGFTHAHSREEEVVYVLGGTCNVRILRPGEEPVEYPLRPGNVVSFPAGTRIAHTFVNRHATEECQLFIVGERRPETDRVTYPEDLAYDEHLAAKRPQRHWKPE